MFRRALAQHSSRCGATWRRCNRLLLPGPCAVAQPAKPGHVGAWPTGGGGRSSGRGWGAWQRAGWAGWSRARAWAREAQEWFGIRDTGGTGCGSPSTTVAAGARQEGALKRWWTGGFRYGQGGTGWNCAREDWRFWWRNIASSRKRGWTYASSLGDWIGCIQEHLGEYGAATD